ncbi:glycosyltransferase family 2 protein [Streptomyces sp. NBC_00388]|uniref:glycosyltransferase family 2 protein n=1 Tax=Streptomyces sp. NBC_00388 TaxID=2975735 RepID=UPI002E225F41
MYVVTALLLRQPDAPRNTQNAAALTTLLRSCTPDRSQIAHLRVQVGPERVDVALFVSAQSPWLAERAALAVITRMLRGTPAFEGWVVSGLRCPDLDQLHELRTPADPCGAGDAPCPPTQENPRGGTMPRARPSVSVIIPNYNYEKTLRACLESVFAQSHPPLDVVVVDDASTDTSRDIARQFPCVLVASPVNRGVSAARNLGVAASRGEILFFLDSDTALAPDALANAVDLLLSDPETGCVHGILAPEPLFDDGPVERYHALHAHFWRRRGVGIVRTAFFALAAIPRAVFEETGPFDENLRDSEDVEYSGRLAARHRIRMTETVIGRHDDVDKYGDMLREQYRRSQLLIPTAAVQQARAGGLTANRPLGVVATGLAIATAPLGFLSLWLLLLPALCVAVFTASDPGLSRFVRQSRGWRYLLWFTAVHFTVHIALVLGAVHGAVRWRLDPNFGPGRTRRPVAAPTTQ